MPRHSRCSLNNPWHARGSRYKHVFEIPLCGCLLSWFERNERVRKKIFYLSFILPAKACGLLTCMLAGLNANDLGLFSF